MGLTAAVASLIGATASAVGTGFSIKSQYDAKDRAKKQMATQRQALELQKKRAQELQAQQDEQLRAEQSTERRDNARSRQSKRILGAQGRSSTIRTSPLGLTGGGKTLLGQ